MWFKKVGLATPNPIVLSRRQQEALKRGRDEIHRRRIQSLDFILSQGLKEIKHISTRELWLIGIVLYWAEGAKQSSKCVSQGIHFSNSDPRMLKIFLEWLHRCARVSDHDIRLRLYLHDFAREYEKPMLKFWRKKLGQMLLFQKTVFKHHAVKRVYSEIQQARYRGQISIKVRCSTVLNRRIEGWIQGISRNVFGSPYSGIV